jgi:hypothetical protein
LTWPPSQELTRLLAAVYNQYQKLPDRATNAAARRDFVFHMTDWLEDVERLTEVFRNPKRVGPESAGNAVYGFLIHALPHLMEAGRLLEGHEIRNPFIDLEDQK